MVTHTDHRDRDHRVSQVDQVLEVVPGHCTEDHLNTEVCCPILQENLEDTLVLILEGQSKGSQVLEMAWEVHWVELKHWEVDH